MAWHHVADESMTAPVRKTGQTVEKTHSVWRCGNCRALAVTSQGERPSGDCGKCRARG